MSHRIGTLVARLICSITLAMSGALCWAQDYAQETIGVSGPETRPSGAKLLSSITSNTTDSFEIVDLPFEFPYFGRLSRQAHVAAHGWINLINMGFILNSHHNIGNNGADFTTGAFPYTPNGKGQERGLDGFIAACWDVYSNLNTGSGAPTEGGVYTWTSGEAPSRRFTISWENARIGGASSPTRFATVQIHLFEGSGQIEFRFSNGTTDFQTVKWVLGLDSYDDARFYAPAGATNQNTGWPANRRLIPRETTYTGRLQFDKLVTDASGTGSTVDADRDLGGLRVELRRDGGIAVAATTTAADGSFSVNALGVAASSSGSLHLLAQNTACHVARALDGPPAEWTISSGIDYAVSSDLGTKRLTSLNDATGATRAAFNIALTCERVRDWAAPRASDPIPELEIVCDDSSASPTRFSKVPQSRPRMTVAGNASANPDAWDDAIVTRTYGRHVLGSISGYVQGDSDHRFDAATTAENAFAEAFGYALWTSVTGATAAIDGESESKSTVLDLEDPELKTARSPQVAGAVTAAVHDLLDAANESIDTIDGPAAPDRFLVVADSLTAPPSTTTFLQAWVDLGHDGFAITRDFVGNGVLADDDSEPNDGASESASLGAVGVRRDARLLNRYTADWYSVSVPSAATTLTVDIVYDRATIPSTVEVELRSAAGALLATGAPAGSSGPIRVAVSPATAGTYRVGVRHVSGTMIPAYGVQAYVPLEVGTAPYRDWTLERPYDESLGVAGGVAPYTIRTSTGALPPGLLAASSTLRAKGTPTQEGLFTFTLEVTDSGSPANVVRRTQSVRIQPPLDLALAPFIGFPLGPPIDAEMTHRGGTPPFSLEIVDGALPEGLSLDSDTFLVSGSAATAGSTHVTLTASDVAGSTDEVALRAVVCPMGAPRGVALDLAEDQSACGVWVDAVLGSKLRFSFGTARKAPRRALSAAVLAPDRSAVVGGRVKGGKGNASGSNVPCPQSGRYFVVAASESGDATRLTAGVSAAPPRKGGGKTPELDLEGTLAVDVGALPGAKLVFRANGDKKRKSPVRFGGLVGPDGTFLALDQVKVTTTALGFTATATLPAGGTWSVLLATTPESQQPGAASWSYTLKQPKGVVFVAE